MQPKKLTVDNLPMWWRPVSCKSYFSENNRKKRPTQQAAGPFTRPAVLSPTHMDEDWQSAFAAAKAAAEHDAQVAQQIKDDAADTQRLQDHFDSLRPDQQSDETSLTTAPLQSPNSSATVWGSCYPILPAPHSMLLTVFHFGNSYTTYQLLPSFEALRSQLLPPASTPDTYVPRLLLPGVNHALAPRPLTLIQSAVDRFFSSSDLTGPAPSLLAPIEEESRVEIVELFNCPSRPSTPLSVSAPDAASTFLG